MSVNNRRVARVMTFVLIAVIIAVVLGVVEFLGSIFDVSALGASLVIGTINLCARIFAVAIGGIVVGNVLKRTAKRTGFDLCGRKSTVALAATVVVGVAVGFAVAFVFGVVVAVGGGASASSSASTSSASSGSLRAVVNWH